MAWFLLDTTQSRFTRGKGRKIGGRCGQKREREEMERRGKGKWEAKKLALWIRHFLDVYPVPHYLCKILSKTRFRSCRHFGGPICCMCIITIFDFYSFRPGITPVPYMINYIFLHLFFMVIAQAAEDWSHRLILFRLRLLDMELFRTYHYQPTKIFVVLDNISHRTAILLALCNR